MTTVSPLRLHTIAVINEIHSIMKNSRIMENPKLRQVVDASITVDGMRNSALAMLDFIDNDDDLLSAIADTTFSHWEFVAKPTPSTTIRSLRVFCNIFQLNNPLAGQPYLPLVEALAGKETAMGSEAAAAARKLADGQTVVGAHLYTPPPIKMPDDSIKRLAILLQELLRKCVLHVHERRMPEETADGVKGYRNPYYVPMKTQYWSVQLKIDLHFPRKAQTITQTDP